MTTQTTFDRSIRYDRETRDYRMELDGRLIGYASTYSQAEITLNEVAYEMLIHGDCATAAELDGHAACDQCGKTLVEEGLRYCRTCRAAIAMDAANPPVQLASWSTATASADPYACSQAHPCNRPNHNHTGYTTASADDPPSDAPGGPLIPGDDGYGKHAALALQTLLATQQQGLCLNCGGKHRTWQCSEIAARLFAPEPWKDVALGRELCRMRWRNFNGFVALIKSVRDDGHLVDYAASYQAFIRDHSPDSTMTIDQVVQVWGRIIGDDSARQQAA